MDDISTIDNVKWSIGSRRAAIIRQLAEQRSCSRFVIAEASAALQLSERYIYQLIRKYRTSQGLLTSLIPKKSNGGKGKSRILDQQENLINQVIKELFLTSQKLKPSYIVEEIRKRCYEQQIPIPSEPTIRRRLRNLGLDRLKERGGNIVQPIVGESPTANYPLSIVQIDHTLV